MAAAVHLVDGLRYVAPSETWVQVQLSSSVGMRLDDALLRLRLPSLPPEWWESDATSGYVRLESDGVGAEARPSHVVRPKDRVHVLMHVHEQVVPNVRPEVLKDDSDILAVSKPAGVEIFCNPMCGAVRNSLLGMLEDIGFKGLYAVHRIDKPVSGVVCMAKNSKAASRLSRCIKGRRVRKQYVARVLAPDGPPLEGLCIDAPLAFDPSTSTAFVSSEGKPAQTLVSRVLSVNGPDDSTGMGATAVVVLEPLTGRTHQIRCHLACAGYVIANDAKYGASSVPRGPFIYRDTACGELSTMLRKAHRPGCEACSFYQQALQSEQPTLRFKEGIFLHSWKYSFESLGLDLEAPLPAWATL